MNGRLYPEDREAAKVEFNKIKGDACDTISLFEAVTVLRRLDIETDQDQLYKEVKSWDLNFDKFCDVYAKKKEEKDNAELKKIIIESFEAVGGKADQGGIVDMQKLQSVFKFFQFDVELEDFLLRNSYDTNSEIFFDGYSQIYGMNAASGQ